MALIKFYKKNEFEKKSTRERYTIERGELYFRKKAGGTPFIFFGGAILLGLYAHWGGGPLHYAAAALFAALGVWQFFYVSRASVSAQEVDARVRSMLGELDLESDALNAGDMDYDAFTEAEKIILYGYAKLPIKDEEAMLRADEADNVGRSSHVQFTCFTLMEDTLQAYSVVKSLLSGEKAHTIMEWPYDRIQAVELEKLAVNGQIEPGSDKTQMRHLPAAVIRSSNKRESRSYAFCEDCRASAQELARKIREKQADAQKERQ